MGSINDLKIEYTYVPDSFLKNIKIENLEISRTDIGKFQLRFSEFCEEFHDRFLIEKRDH